MCDPLPDSPHRTRLTVIGIGNPYRHDDAVGLAVARQLRCTLPAGVDVLEGAGEPTGLFAAWEGADAVWIIDAAHSAAPPGTVHRIPANERTLPADLVGPSTHALGLADTIEISRTLGWLPRHLVIYAICGHTFSAGLGLDPEVAAAARNVAAAIRAETAIYAAREPDDAAREPHDLR
ncbi:Ni,Fe-hydrogenase maturation factor [Frankia casuarinae]|jgi:hydrogenase maturation protease|uniref:Peptidase M52, hydrogen uptake protein n=1 Tax=Frankia casuarinae (strain DSM 45818 / CECT 9043 / HFP020203 / CcI3) TaxID=106370 RepID=Q2J4F1_FRACC|nr:MULTISPECIES: hydrogenase maturation protease [Frankia]ABD13841.1 peptidase M52, hydrogen uptake protein [Frankia casuarinae]ETA04015.1 Ni,Fe-hydrogenase maturation factor [Frankia sp. CcI6]EYT94261.1 Ni,Fe-hydrogenase maturation factor [Frankia casuarinae]KEZ37769.1 hydrogenase maturation protease [Frankia sp. CeD]KFB06913.1 hydrogenase maturation protease [Frankia sp. Allo2]